MKTLARREGASRQQRSELRVAIAGLGAIGLKVAEALDHGIPGCVLTAVSANDRGKAAARLSHLVHQVPVELADIVIECAPAKLLPAIACRMSSRVRLCRPLMIRVS